MTVISFPRPAIKFPKSEGTSSAARVRERRGIVAFALDMSHVYRRAAIVVVVALFLSVAGSMVASNREVAIVHDQQLLTQIQSDYTSLLATTSANAPVVVAQNAATLHLVSPTTEVQVPSGSTVAKLPLPKFLGYGPAISRTIRP